MVRQRAPQPPDHEQANSEERKQRVLSQGTPSVVSSIADAVVIKGGNLFFLARADGTVPLEPGHGFRLDYDVSSNPGHLLWAGAVEPARARVVAERLMHPDMYNEWGVRTLSKEDHRYDPIGYHLGTVWPHDNAIIAAGFRRCGLNAEAGRIFDGLLDVSRAASTTSLPRGLSPPQAWAAGSLPYLLQTSLGLVPEAFEGRLRVVQPHLPSPVEHLWLRDLRVGSATVDLAFDRSHETGEVSVEVLRVDGDLDVRVEATPEGPS